MRVELIKRIRGSIVIVNHIAINGTINPYKNVLGWAQAKARVTSKIARISKWQCWHKCTSMSFPQHSLSLASYPYQQIPQETSLFQNIILFTNLST